MKLVSGIITNLSWSEGFDIYWNSNVDETEIIWELNDSALSSNLIRIYTHDCVLRVQSKHFKKIIRVQNGSSVIQGHLHLIKLTPYFLNKIPILKIFFLLSARQSKYVCSIAKRTKKMIKQPFEYFYLGLAHAELWVSTEKHIVSIYFFFCWRDYFN